MGREARRAATVAAASLAALCALPATAEAVLSGTNGRIVFLSGRDSPDFNDNSAKLFLRTVIGSTGGGVSGATITPSGGQHRHPTWSPDRTKIAYARGTPGSATTENFDIYIQDMATGVATPITNTADGLSADRPAWSPDGTRIAYEDQDTTASAERDIIVYTVANGSVLDLTDSPDIEGKPAWSPDSQTLYYVTGDPSAMNTLNIVSEPAGGGTFTLAVADSGISEFQPSISPDGTQMCFTLGTGFNATTDILVAPITSPPSGGLDFSDDAAAGDYNCTWSPDGTKIAYVQGVFMAGALVMEPSDDSLLVPFTLEDDPNNFDGNPDWAPDGRPTCPDTTANVAPNASVSIPLACVDNGPAYEQTPVRESIANDGDPTKGTLGDVQQGDPSTVTYTPNANFIGTDSLQYIGFDDFGFGLRGTVTINVAVPAQPTPNPANVAPVVSKLKITKRIRKGRALPRRTSRKRGHSISFSLSEDATVSLSFARRRSGGQAKTRGTVRIKAKKGTNRVIFKGRLSRRSSLSAGSYRLTLVARDSANAGSKSKRASFRLLAAKKRRG